MRAPRNGETMRNASAGTAFKASAAADTRPGSSWRFATMATAALAPAGVLIIRRASDASLVFTATVALQCAGRQLWISSIAVLRTTLSAGAALRILDNRVGPDNSAVKKTTPRSFSLPARRTAHAKMPRHEESARHARPAPMGSKVASPVAHDLVRRGAGRRGYGRMRDRPCGHGARAGAEEGGHLSQRRRLLRTRRARRFGPREFRVRRNEVGDFLATLAVLERGGSSVRAAAFPMPADTSADAATKLQTVVMSLDGKEHDLHVGYIARSAGVAAVVPAGHRQGRRQPADVGHRAEPVGRRLERRVAVPDRRGAAGVRRVAGARR